MNIPSSERLEKVYGESVESAARLKALAEQFQEKYGHDEAAFFTAPGRRSSEITQTITAAR